jgi:hypothetical protein
MASLLRSMGRSSPTHSKLHMVSYAALGAALMLLLAVSVQYGPRALSAFPNEDYNNFFRASARLLVEGQSPYQLVKFFYPLYTVFWIFIPLLAGDWTRFIWVLAPIPFLFLATGRKAIVLVLSYPFLVHLRFGQFDGWLLLPLLFLLRDTERLAPLSAALFLLKPQTAWALVGYRLLAWTKQRSWRKLLLSLTVAAILVVPAFLIRPGWGGEWLDAVASHPAEQCQNATVWGWSCFGGLWLPFSLAEALLAVVLVGHSRDRASAVQLLGLLVTPILYAYDLVLVTPTLKTWGECILILAVSWLAVCIDLLAGGWGGAYSLIPLAALALRARK